MSASGTAELAVLAERDFASFDEAARAVVALAQRLLGMEILLVTQVVDGRYLILDAECAIPIPIGPGAALQWEQSLCYRCLERGAPAVAPELRDEPEYWDAWTKLRPLLGVDWDLRAFVTVPIRLPDGALFGTLCAHHTAPLAVGDAHRESLAILARMLAYEIGRERTRARLEQAHDALVEMERRRVELISEVAHEVRAPLMVIDGYVEGMVDGVVPPDPEALGLVRAEASRVRRLLEDLEHLVRLRDPVEAPFTPEPVDLARVAVEAVRRFAPLAGAQQVTLRLRVDQAPTRGEPERLERAVANLLRNALNATAPGAAIELVTRTESDASVTIAVRDDGTGMPPAEAAQAFDRFFRGETGRTSHAGSGLGLAIVREIAERHGGHARLESELGRGTVVTLAFPAAGANV